MSNYPDSRIDQLILLLLKGIITLIIISGIISIAIRDL